MARHSNGRSALHRHLSILDAFDALHPLLTLSDISARTGTPHSTAHRLVGELVREGMLEQLPDRTFRLGMRLWEYASRVPAVIQPREAAKPWLTAAHARIRQHVQLGVRDGTDVVFLERISAPKSVVNATLIGGRIQLHASSCGLVLLAHSPDRVLDELIELGTRVYTPTTVTAPDALRGILRRVRSEAVSVTPGYIHPESMGVAVPVHGPDGSVSAALGAVIPNDGRHPRAVIEVLRVAAAGTARSLADIQRASADTGPGGVPGGPTASGVSERSWAYIASLQGVTAG